MNDLGWSEIFDVDDKPVDGKLEPFTNASKECNNAADDVEATADLLQELTQTVDGFNGQAGDAFGQRVATFVTDMRTMIDPMREAGRSFISHHGDLDELQLEDERELRLANERNDAKSEAEDALVSAQDELRRTSDSVNAEARSGMPDEARLNQLESDRWQQQNSVDGAGRRMQAANEELQISRRAHTRLTNDEDALDDATAAKLREIVLPGPLPDFFSHEEVDLEAPVELWMFINAQIEAAGHPPLALHEHARLSNEQLIDFYQTMAYEFAGIENWDPEAGLEGQDANVQAAYDAYGTLYLSNPEDFYWMGLGNIVGPPLYGGFVDLYTMRAGLQDGSISAEEVAEWIVDGIPGGSLVSETAGALTGMGEQALAEELFWIEGTFLSMQKEIFDDMVWQHLAYSEGGIELMEQLLPDYESDPDQRLLLVESWRAIENGDPSLAANLMVDREQNHTIQDDYTNIWNHSIVGSSLMTAMSFIAPNPVPGGDSFFESVIAPRMDIYEAPSIPLPDVPWIDVPFAPESVPLGPDVSVPTGIDLTANIANVDDRWQWISDDISPTYLDLVENDPGAVADLAATPQSERMDQWRTLPNIGPLSYEPS